MLTSLGIFGGGRWRIRGWNGGLSMRTVIGCAWMLDGATKNCVYTLSLASSELLNSAFEDPSETILPLRNRFHFVAKWSRGASGANDSAYGNSGLSGVIVYDRGRLIGPPGKYEPWSSSASSGSVGLGYDNRPGELILACRNRHASCAFV
ncbi:hypothetical protein PIB30_015101 [Stylosanthes scabra]|uniref:Uncharacterized protein n=1 Tax=Stylosanthes scabra TaxID=79078 RepID=A0ABU6R774_9FABA|nr:hypothetical protein [Stylosanthes scabra]